jgi:penicillin-binding protein 1A
MLILFFFIFYGAEQLPRLPHPLARIIETPKTKIYAATGEKLITLGRKEPVPLSRISPHFINAILAVEDHKFMEHSGLSKLRTLKALYITLVQPGRIQGASTITQQLAKNLFFSFKQTYLRKFKELLVALQIEYTFSKEEILHAYVNQIAFGAGAQGVERAARVFFAKPAADLTLGEATLLAGLPQSPSSYNPYRHYDRALKRREVVIHRMVATGYLTREKADLVLQKKPTLTALHADARTGSYFLDTLIGQLIQLYGKDVVFHGGIRVTTTLDTAMQRAARTAVTKGMDELDADMGINKSNKTIPQVALVAIDTGSGAVKALMGGRDYYGSEFNRAVSSRRRVGSGFTPFLYYAAMKQQNFHGGTVVTNQKIKTPIKDGQILPSQKVTREHQGNIILKQALTLSVDSIATQLMEKIGAESVIDIARICGISSPLESVHSRGMATAQVTPREMAVAYATFASGGVHHDPFFIWRVEDALGHVIYEHLIQEKKVLDAATVFQVVDMMQSVVDKGPARRVRQQGFSRPAAGKTGRSSEGYDAWFTGFTPGLSTSVWIGYDTRKKMEGPTHSGTTGDTAAVSIWTSFMSEALKDQPARPFRIPDSISFKTVDARTGCPPQATGVIPTVIIPLKPGQTICGDTP